MTKTRVRTVAPMIMALSLAMLSGCDDDSGTSAVYPPIPDQNGCYAGGQYLKGPLALKCCAGGGAISAPGCPANSTGATTITSTMTSFGNSAGSAAAALGNSDVLVAKQGASGMKFAALGSSSNTTDAKRVGTRLTSIGNAGNGAVAPTGSRNSGGGGGGGSGLGDSGSLLGSLNGRGTAPSAPREPGWSGTGDDLNGKGIYSSGGAGSGGAGGYGSGGGGEVVSHGGAEHEVVGYGDRSLALADGGIGEDGLALSSLSIFKIVENRYRETTKTWDLSEARIQSRTRDHAREIQQMLRNIQN